MLLAFKAICLNETLTGSEKRVAAAILDHFNREDGQCDPSLGTVADLLGISERTVIRAAKKLDALSILKKFRHGGRFHRNQYEPNWDEYPRADVRWNARRQERRGMHQQKLSPLQGHGCRFAGDKNVNQTFPSNLSIETFASGGVVSSQPASNKLLSCKGLAKEEECPSTSRNVMLHVKQTPSRIAAHDSAERRWNVELQDRYRDDPDNFARIIEAIDEELQEGVTQEEMRRRGAGLPHLLSELLRRGVK